jgi:hypothetical protein
MEYICGGNFDFRGEENENDMKSPAEKKNVDKGNQGKIDLEIRRSIT